MSADESNNPADERLPVVGQSVVMIIAMVLTVWVVWIIVAAGRAVSRAESSDSMMLEGFELLVGSLLVGTLALVVVGVALRLLIPSRFGPRPFGAHLLHTVYDRLGLAVYSTETPAEHAANPYRDLSDVELCDVIEQIDAEKNPERWNAVLHEVKARVERFEPARIG